MARVRETSAGQKNVTMQIPFRWKCAVPIIALNHDGPVDVLSCLVRKRPSGEAPNYQQCWPLSHYLAFLLLAYAFLILA